MTIFNIRNVLVTLVAIAKIVFTLASLSAQESTETPSHLYASVRIINGGTAGSGTIISRGKEWSAGLSCAHCFAGKINGEFFVDYPTGTRVKAVLRRINRDLDLSLFFVPTSSVIEVANVPKRMPSIVKYHVCGYPETIGPKFYSLTPDYSPVRQFNSGMVRWAFRTQDGPHYWKEELLLKQVNAQIIGGNSGSGIFANGQVCSVLSHNDAAIQGGASPVCFGCPHEKLVWFLKGCADEQQWCGEWFAEPAQPVQSVAPPPPSLPERGPFKPNPNIKVDPVPKHDTDPADEEDSASEDVVIIPGKDSHGYKGKGRPPKDLRGPRTRSAGIDELNGRVRKLEELLQHGVPKGEQGPPGNDGNDGLNPTPPADNSHPMLAVILAGAIFVIGLAIDSLRRTRTARSH